MGPGLNAGYDAKSYLCESLWPGELHNEYLNDRFHQLILRMNRKIKDFVVFDGQFYKLNEENQVL
jgi:hypothetical protein